MSVQCIVIPVLALIQMNEEEEISIVIVEDARWALTCIVDDEEMKQHHLLYRSMRLTYVVAM